MGKHTTITIAGRDILLYTPAGKPKRLILALHAGNGSARGYRELLSPLLTDDLPACVAFPQGTSAVGAATRRTWNSGHIGWQTVDDVSWLSTVIQASPVSRVYVVGYSNGGMMAYRLAAEHPDLVIAFAAFAATIGGRRDTEAPLSVNVPTEGPAVPVLHVHGWQDTIVRPLGGQSSNSDRVDLPVLHGLDMWRAHNGIAGDLPIQLDVVHQTAAGDDLSFLRYQMRRGVGHEWQDDYPGMMLDFFVDVG